jgi:hypothetical protein
MCILPLDIDVPDVSALRLMQGSGDLGELRVTLLLGRSPGGPAPTTWTLSRQADVDFSLVTFVDGGSILTRAESEAGRLTDFGGKRIAVMLAYADKLEHYLKENLLVKSLHPKAYENNPNFLGMIQRLGLKFKAHKAFFKADIDDTRASLSYKFKKALSNHAAAVVTTDATTRTAAARETLDMTFLIFICD